MICSEFKRVSSSLISGNRWSRGQSCYRGYCSRSSDKRTCSASCIYIIETCINKILSCDWPGSCILNWNRIGPSWNSYYYLDPTSIVSGGCYTISVIKSTSKDPTSSSFIAYRCGSSNGAPWETLVCARCRGYEGRRGNDYPRSGEELVGRCECYSIFRICVLY